MSDDDDDDDSDVVSDESICQSRHECHGFISNTEVREGKVINPSQHPPEILKTKTGSFSRYLSLHSIFNTAAAASDCL